MYEDLPWLGGWYRTCARLLAGRPGRAGGGLMTASLRPVAAPFVAAAPGGARVRARLRVCAQDEAVLWAAGGYLGSLAGRDLAARCAEGRLDAKGRARSRAVRKRALTAASSSRWAGAITRISEDQLRLAGLERQLEAGTASVVRGGKALLRTRNNLAAAGLTPDQWRREWESAGCS